MWGYILITLHYWANEIPTILQLIRNLFRWGPNDLKKRYGDWAVVTGASDGIGKAYVTQLLEKGINVVLIGRNREKLEGVVRELEPTHSAQTKLIIADFAQGRPIYKSIAKQLEDVDVGILVNNVGIQYNYPMAIAELPEDEIWDNVNVNITSAVMLTRIILPKMIEKNKGAIVNISSASGYQPQPYMNLYAASKAYVTSFSEALRGELRKTKITVQTLTPYYISSKINHFEKKLQEVSFFIPNVDTYVRSALSDLGVVSLTTGFWPHRLFHFFNQAAPTWLRTEVVRRMYKRMSLDYKKREKTR